MKKRGNYVYCDPQLNKNSLSKYIMTKKLLVYVMLPLLGMVLPIIIGNTVVTYAQQTEIFTNQDVLYHDGIFHFKERNFLLAQQKLQAFLQQSDFSLSDEAQLKQINAQYYVAESAYHLNNPDAEFLLVKFIEKNATHPLVKKAYYFLGQLYFGQNYFKDVLACFQNVDPLDLSLEQRDEYYFQMAYSYFVSKQFDDAYQLFGKIINKKNKYYYDANYYYGVIAYFNEDFSTALYSFKLVEDNAKYERELPYYITLIYYQQERYDELLEYAEPKTRSTNIKNSKEINQLVGQTYFNRRQFREALPYFDYYNSQSSRVRKEDLFQLGYTQYQLQMYQEAIGNFTQLNNERDSIGQNAMYHLADCYLKQKEKAKARNAFKVASEINYDPVIKEVSDFNYAKLSYELGFISESINGFQTFMQQYPQSQFQGEAGSLLTSIFETTQNYRDALTILEEMPNKTNELWQMYQRIAYYRGVEMFNDRRYEEAITHFDKTIANNYDNRTLAMAHFWKGETFARQNKPDQAFSNFDAFIGTSGNKAISEKVQPATANYNMGYLLFKEREYADALPYFERAINALSGQSSLLNNNSPLSNLYPDAVLRSGDCHFMQRNYIDARERYNQIVQYNLKGADYAYYQKGMLSGLLGEYDTKIVHLRTLINDYPQSLYTDDALYQIAITQVAVGNNNDAIATHQSLISDYETSEYVPKSLVNLGLIYFNLGDYDRSLQFYELVMQQFPKNAEAQEALLGVRDVFIATGDADGYAAFIQQFPGLEISTTAQDSLSYEIAESYYQKGDCDNAIREFTSYLTDFSQGAFTIYAHYYRGQCFYSQQKYSSAGKDYDYIINQPPNLFTEQALDKGARVALYIDKNYEKAYDYYKRLYDITSRRELKYEATRGLVRSSFHLKKATELDEYINILVNSSDATPDDVIDAYYFQAMLANENQQYTKALAAFQRVSARTQNEKGAQARYYTAEIYFKQNQLDSAYDACLLVRDETSSQVYWVAKSYILIADIYKSKGELFQAKATLQSIIENYPPEDKVKQEARDKLAEIEDMENSSSRIQPAGNNNDYLEMNNN